MTNEEDLEAVWLDRGPGSGSLSEEEAYVEEVSREGPNDGRSVTRTTFYTDPDNSRPTENSSWEELASLNDGVGNPERGKQNHRADRLRLIGLLANELECTGYQRKRVEYVIRDIDNLREFFPTVPMEVIILGTISLVVDQETEDFDNWIVRRDDFQRLMDDVGMEMSQLWTVREKLQSDTDLFD